MVNLYILFDRTNRSNRHSLCINNLNSQICLSYCIKLLFVFFKKVKKFSKKKFSLFFFEKMIIQSENHLTLEEF